MTLLLGGPGWSCVCPLQDPGKSERVTDCSIGDKGDPMPMAGAVGRGVKLGVVPSIQGPAWWSGHLGRIGQCFRLPPQSPWSWGLRTGSQTLDSPQTKKPHYSLLHGWISSPADTNLFGRPVWGHKGSPQSNCWPHSHYAGCWLGPLLDPATLLTAFCLLSGSHVHPLAIHMAGPALSVPRVHPRLLAQPVPLAPPNSVRPRALPPHCPSAALRDPISISFLQSSFRIPRDMLRIPGAPPCLGAGHECVGTGCSSNTLKIH